MVVKNEELYLDVAISSILEISEKIPYTQIIVVNDNSNDKTSFILEKYKDNDKFIIINNLGVGKIVGTNLALSYCNAEYVKFVDGDDVLCGDYYSLPDAFTVLYHNYIVFSDKNENNIKIGNWLEVNSHEVHSRFRTIPKAMFIFKSDFIKSFFPIPVSLPFEDLWINLIASESGNIQYLQKYLYRYRSHLGQYYGGHNNFNPSKRIRMANRFISYYEFLTKNKHPFTFDFPSKTVFRYAHVLLKPSLYGYLSLANKPKLMFKAIYYSLGKFVALHWRIRS
jgi:glycosyltransferase involved in cell wall biosynthesis